MALIYLYISRRNSKPTPLLDFGVWLIFLLFVSKCRCNLIVIMFRKSPMPVNNIHSCEGNRKNTHLLILHVALRGSRPGRCRPFFFLIASDTFRQILSFYLLISSSFCFLFDSHITHCNERGRRKKNQPFCLMSIRLMSKIWVIGRQFAWSFPVSRYISAVSRQERRMNRKMK